MSRQRIIGAVTMAAVLLLVFGLALPVSMAQDYGSNWTAQYYTNRDFSGSPAATQNVTAVNFNWGNGSPIPGTIGTDEFSVRFSAAPFFFAGTYQFTVTADDGARVSIDGAIVPEFANNFVTSLTFSRDMTAGNHNLVVEYVEGQGDASVQFFWTQTSGQTGATAIPGTAVPSLPTATMTGARGLAVRSGPYLGATLLRVALPDQPYPVSARNLDEGLYPWYYISLPSGTSGWASGRFLTLNVDPNMIPVQATVFDTIDNPAETGVTAAPRAYMNIRRRPSERTEQLGQVPIGERVPLLNRTAQSGENYWYQVRYEGIVGWIYAPYVSTNGPIDDVPIL